MRHADGSSLPPASAALAVDALGEGCGAARAGRREAAAPLLLQAPHSLGAEDGSSKEMESVELSSTSSNSSIERTARF